MSHTTMKIISPNFPYALLDGSKAMALVLKKASSVLWNDCLYFTKINMLKTWPPLVMELVAVAFVKWLGGILWD